MIITIDGPVATGKSSIAKALARELGYIYFDTGAMYRCLTYAMLKQQIDLNDLLAVTQFLTTFNFDIKIRQGEKYYYVENENVTEKIRGTAVTTAVSAISAMKPVRDKLVNLQQKFALGVNAIFEGRDMGTVVFPQADIKIFLTGKAEVRAKRRFEELLAKFPIDKFPLENKNLTLEQTLEEINKRDHYDSHRQISPLCQAKDALVIDTSALSLTDIIFLILEYKDTLKTKVT